MSSAMIPVPQDSLPRHAPEAFPAVLAALDEGHDLDDIAAMPGMPSRATLYRLAREREDVRLALSRAREMRADGIVREAGRILDTVDCDVGGGIGSARVAKATQQAGFRRWLAGCFNRPVYGDVTKLDVDAKVLVVQAFFDRRAKPVDLQAQDDQDDAMPHVQAPDAVRGEGG